MKRIAGIVLASVLGVFALAALAFYGVSHGWGGIERDAGTIHGKRLPDTTLAARAAEQQALAAGPQAKQVLFGDLHVHTTYSTDAFQFSLPLNGGTGTHPVADACDFARFCSSLDFWAITDHAEASTPLRWKRTKEAMRQCQAVAGGDVNPDMVSFIGFEWTQVGRTPDEHYGHKNVIFEGLADEGLAARPIASGGATTQALRTKARGLPPGVVMEDSAHAQTYLDFNHFIKEIQQVRSCDPATPSNKLSPDCFEEASTPGELVRRLDQQKLNPLIIPHGSSWGFYTPPGTSWDKALNPKEDPSRFSLIEVYSGHGNSEEYRNWRDIKINADGRSATCPEPSQGYLPSCWRAGQIIQERCTNAGLGKAECDRRAAVARNAYANMGVAGHLAIKGETQEDWLDSGQCNDCFLPPFNHRPQTSVQYGLAISRFDETPNNPARFRWGFIGSSDNHHARPGTGYKQNDRHVNTESSGPISARWRRLLLGKPQEKDAEAHPMAQSELFKQAGFQLTEFERQTSFFLTGGLAAAHAPSRDRHAIWQALQRREVYATSGQRIMLWFDKIDTATGQRLPMGSIVKTDKAPTFEVRAVGALKQKPGCPNFSSAGMDANRLKTLCSGECFNPSDTRSLITRIEVIRIQPQARLGEPVGGLIKDSLIVHHCKPDANGCTFRFSDPEFARLRRDTLYYVRAIQEPEPVINGGQLNCERDAKGQCLKVHMCYGDYRSAKSDCLKPAEPRAWSSPIYLDIPKG